MIIMLFGLGLWFILIAIAIYQIGRLIFERKRKFKRLAYVFLILALIFFSFLDPLGAIDWEKYEGDNLLVAERETTANCRNILKLKKENEFKYINRCFGVDFYLGKYIIKNDTIFLEFNKDFEFMDKKSIAILKYSLRDSTNYSLLDIQQNGANKRNILMKIKEIKLNSILNKKQPRYN